MSNTKQHIMMKKRGGGVGAMKGRQEDAGNPDVMKEAKELKHGGKVHGHKGKHRIKKARGGGIGSDKSPFSSAGRGGMNDSPAASGKGDVSGGGAFVGAHGK